ncbi:MAG: hypothetical protein ACLQHS_19380 [Candidatus Limnocylindrales bacterium]
MTDTNLPSSDDAGAREQPETEQSFPEFTDAEWHRFQRRLAVRRLHEAGYTARDIAALLGECTYRTVAMDLAWTDERWDEEVRAILLLDPREGERRFELTLANMPMESLRELAASRRSEKWRRR